MSKTSYFRYETTNTCSRDALRNLRISDVCLAFFAISSIAFDDGSLISQLSRILIVAGTITEFGKNRIQLTGFHAWLLGFAGIVFISRFWAFDPSAASEIFKTVAFNVICFGCVAFLLYRDKRRIRLVMGCMVVAPLLLEVRVISIGGVFAYFSHRTVGSINSNALGLFASIALYFAFLFWREKKQICWILFMALNLAAALLSASRKALMVVCLVAILITLFDSKTKTAFGKLSKLLIVVAIILFALFLVMNVPFLYELIGVRMQGMMSGLLGSGNDVDASTSTRMQLIDYGIDWFRNRPLVGYGGDNFKALMAAYHPRQSALYAHNNYVELLVDYGLLGLLVYYSCYVSIICSAVRNRTQLTFADFTILCLTLGILIMDYGNVEYYYRNSQLFIALAWAAIVSCHNRPPLRDSSR